jgi:hypothetical protein
LRLNSSSAIFDPPPDDFIFFCHYLNLPISVPVGEIGDFKKKCEEINRAIKLSLGKIKLL